MRDGDIRQLLPECKRWVVVVRRRLWEVIEKISLNMVSAVITAAINRCFYSRDLLMVCFKMMRGKRLKKKEEDADAD